MATRPQTIAHLLDQAGEGVTARAMFGEYAVYEEGRVVALVCDDRLDLKPTAPDRALLDAPEGAPPYPGAKPHLVVGPDLRDESDALARLLAATAAALPEPKARPGRASPGRERPSGPAGRAARRR